MRLSRAIVCVAACALIAMPLMASQSDSMARAKIKIAKTSVVQKIAK